MSAAKKLINLRPNSFGVKAFLDYVGGKFKLAKSNKIFCNYSENHVTLLYALKLKYILNNVVSIGILY
jgi:hypothetical protein